MSITDAERKRKEESDYLAPGSRDGCHRCFYLTVTSQNTTRCVMHRIQVAKAGICSKFNKAQR